MKLTDFADLKSEISFDFMSESMQATIVREVSDTGTNRYGVYIPRMMMGIDISNGPEDRQIKFNRTKCLNTKVKKLGDDKICLSNYVDIQYVPKYNMINPYFQVGESVLVGVIDQDIKTLYIKSLTEDCIKNRPSDITQMYAPASGTYNGDELGDNNSYYLRLDSVNKKVRLHLSDSQKEKAQMDLTFDGANGLMTLSDGDREIGMSVDDDIIYMKNKGGSSITMTGGDIDIVADNLYIKTKDSIKYETSKFEGKSDDEERTADSVKLSWDSLEMEGDKWKYDYSKIEGDSDNWKHTCDKNTIDGLLAVTDWISAGGGVAFNGGKTMSPMPIDPQIDSKGNAVMNGPTSDNAVLSKPLIQILTQMATMLDSLVALIGAPPTNVAMLQSQISKLISMKVKG